MSRKEKRKRKSGFFRLCLMVLVFLAVLAAGWYFLLGKLYQEVHYEEASTYTNQSLGGDGVVNILLIGNDSRQEGEDGRSDAMILLSINDRAKKIYMTSILRDIYVEIPGHDGNRLNAAYAYGGPELLMQTVEQNFGIDVNRYVQVNFEAFANLVDAVGGVDLELSTEELEYVNGYLVEYNMLTGREEGTDYMDTSAQGTVHLNGAQALAYSRNRYIGTDFGRTERQRKVLSAVIGNLPAAFVENPGQLVNGILPNLTTNLKLGECFSLSFQAGKLALYHIEQGTVPLEGTYKDATIRGMSVLEIDFEANREYLHRIAAGK